MAPPLCRVTLVADLEKQPDNENARGSTRFKQPPPSASKGAAPSGNGMPH